MLRNTAALASLVAAPAAANLISRKLKIKLDLLKRAEFVYTLPPFPLSLWTEIVKMLRIKSRMGQSLPFPDLSNITASLQPLVMYYLVMLS
jgi:hypothetical protein